MFYTYYLLNIKKEQICNHNFKFKETKSASLQNSVFQFLEIFSKNISSKGNAFLDEFD